MKVETQTQPNDMNPVVNVVSIPDDLQCDEKMAKLGSLCTTAAPKMCPFKQLIQ